MGGYGGDSSPNKGNSVASIESTPTMPTKEDVGAATLRCVSTDKASQTDRALFYGNNDSSGSRSLTLGGELFVNNGRLGLGGGNANKGMRIGSLATLDGQSGLRALAIGAGDGATLASGIDAIAIGTEAQASNNSDVALGAKSVTAKAVATTSTTINGDLFNFAGAKPIATVSIGTANQERTLTNLAAGRLTATSTDGVNGSQLYATNQSIDTLGTTVTTQGTEIERLQNNSLLWSDELSAYNAAHGTGQTGKITNVANGVISKTSSDAINGSQLHNVAKSVADHLGGNAVIDGEGNLRGPTYVVQSKNHQTVYDAFGAVDSNLTALNKEMAKISDGGGIKYFHANSTEADSRATGENSIAVGPDSVASATDSVAMGRNAVASDANSVALGAGSKTAEVVATTGTTINGQHYAFSGDAPVGTVSVGEKGSERTITNVAAGRIAADSTDAVNGSQIYATNQAIGALKTDISDISQNAVRYDATPDGKRTNSITLQGGDPNAPVVLSNVAVGVKKNDAVNVGQMETISVKTLTDAKQYTDDVAIQTLGQANSYTDGKIAALNQDIAGLRGDIGDVRSEARQAAAIGLAAASLRYDERPGKLSAAVGGGFWRGEGAFAMGLGYTSQDSKIRTNASLTAAGGNVGGGVGLSYTFN